MTKFRDFDGRYQLANELHARPFPVLTAPCRAAFVALKHTSPVTQESKAADRAHLIALLDRFGAEHPQPEATHYSGKIGKHHLKWESHTEFVTYTIFGDGAADVPFSAETFEMFPADWLEKTPGERMTSALIRVELGEDVDEISNKLGNWFVPESLAVSQVLDGQGAMGSDFRIDPAGHVRLALFVSPEMGAHRIGRIVQRLCEIETYKTMAMLGLMESRRLGGRLAEMDGELAALVGEMREEGAGAAATLDRLLKVSAELETVLAETVFRFGATRAYARLVNQRIEVLRETRMGGRQTFAEFMMRRFDPAMRTVEATETRLNGMAERAERAANLLRTRVDVDRSLQNQELLKSMDRRADLQLRLQRTVEGLSVVAVSYYAVNILGYLIAPLFEQANISKGWGMAVLTVFVIALVWLVIQRIRKSVE
ncbi:DUF3422 domain-containing protein [Rhodobacteraceae bacterium]|nr:DUF3422 domain-containing protein [Paracoccaceae bacterium]